MTPGARRLARFVDSTGQPRLGRVEGVDNLGRETPTTTVVPLHGSVFGETHDAGPPLPLAGLQLLPPVAPSKVVGIGSNYRCHAAEMGRSVPTVPKIFLMPSTAVVGPGVPVALPPGTQRVDHEAELGVVIGRDMCRVAEEDVWAHVLGYTCVNDVTARDFQRSDKVFGRAKGFDTFCPLGPWITTGAPHAGRRVRAWVDGVLRQDGHTDDLVFGIPALLSFVSHVMTLLPGDVIATGTPAGVGPVVAGQAMTVEVAGLGQLTNPVIDRVDR